MKEGLSCSYMVEAVPPAGSGSTQPRDTHIVPMYSGHIVGLVPQPSSVPLSNAGVTMCDADQKRSMPFILRKRHSALSMKSAC